MHPTAWLRGHLPDSRVLTLAGGVLCIVAGLGMLGFVAWMYYGTDLVARHTQQQLRDDIRARWEYPTPADVLGPQAASPELGSADALVRVPWFGDDYEMPLVEGVRGDDLREGIGHFPGTGPGQIGNFAVAAHRVEYGDPFGKLHALRPGDDVVIETSDATYRYRLDTDPNDLVVPFNAAWVLADTPVLPEGRVLDGMPVSDSTGPSRALITLTTCSELFHADRRMVAFGHLVDTAAKP